MASSQFIRPEDVVKFGLPAGTWHGHAFLDKDHIGRFILETVDTFDVNLEVRQKFGEIIWRSYSKDGKKLLRQEHRANIYRTVFPGGFKQFETSLLSVGEANHKLKLKYFAPRPESNLPACWKYKLESSRKSENVSQATMEV